MSISYKTINNLKNNVLEVILCLKRASINIWDKFQFSTIIFNWIKIKKTKFKITENRFIKWIYLIFPILKVNLKKLQFDGPTKQNMLLKTTPEVLTIAKIFLEKCLCTKTTN